MNAFPVQVTPDKKTPVKPGVDAGQGFPQHLGQWPAYLTAVGKEWQRISWPPQLQVVGLSVVVVVIVLAISGLLWGIDTIWRLLVSLIVPIK
jgi:preprotein translocase SecE subunit